MKSNRVALLPSVEFDVVYGDTTIFGGALSGRADESVLRCARAVLDTPIKRQTKNLVMSSSAIYQALIDKTGFGRAFEGERLREEYLYPRAEEIRPSQLAVRVEGRDCGLLPLDASLVPELARLIGAWESGERPANGGPANGLWQSLRDLGAIAECLRLDRIDARLTYAGHATALACVNETRVLVDPFLCGTGQRFPRGYQPFTATELSPTTILITHSHADHFHVGSLLRFGADVEIVVPTVHRESLVSVDMAARLSELGFRNVTRLGWHESLTRGAFKITAIPFRGEQATSSRILHPEVRNEGNMYLVDDGVRRYAFTADAGRDASGDAAGEAAESRARHGSIDVLFGGYRAWSMYPIQWINSTLCRNLLFVPREQLSVRQRVMNGVHEAVDTAELWGATLLCPYADGGAPWYWERGLGPRLDVPKRDNVHFDPRPERVRDAASNRSTGTGTGNGKDVVIPSAVRVEIVRPGDTLALSSDGQPTLGKLEGHAWPYSGTSAAALEGLGLGRAKCRATDGLVRKRALLRLLAAREVERAGLDVTDKDAQRVSDELRRAFGLERAGAMRAWLTSANLSESEFPEVVFEWAAVERLEEHFESEVATRTKTQVAFATMQDLHADAD